MITILAALTGITRYAQILLVPQALAAGKTDGLELFRVYGEFSLMADIKVLAWGVFLGLALLCLAPVFRKRKLERGSFLDADYLRPIVPDRCRGKGGEFTSSSLCWDFGMRVGANNRYRPDGDLVQATGS